eukprot:RCo003285
MVRPVALVEVLHQLLHKGGVLRGEIVPLLWVFPNIENLNRNLVPRNLVTGKDIPFGGIPKNQLARSSEVRGVVSAEESFKTMHHNVHHLVPKIRQVPSSKVPIHPLLHVLLNDLQHTGTFKKIRTLRLCVPLPTPKMPYHQLVRRLDVRHEVGIVVQHKHGILPRRGSPWACQRAPLVEPVTNRRLLALSRLQAWPWVGGAFHNCNQRGHQVGDVEQAIVGHPALEPLLRKVRHKAHRTNAPLIAHVLSPAKRRVQPSHVQHPPVVRGHHNDHIFPQNTLRHLRDVANPFVRAHHKPTKGLSRRVRQMRALRHPLRLRLKWGVRCGVGQVQEKWLCWVMTLQHSNRFLRQRLRTVGVIVKGFKRSVGKASGVIVKSRVKTSGVSGDSLGVVPSRSMQ